MTAELKDYLRASFDDYRLSRSEKRALKGALDDADVSTHDRNVLRSEAFALAKDHLEGPHRRDVLDWLQEVVKLLSADDGPARSSVSEAFFSPGDACRDAIIRQLSSAGRQADLCVFTITDNQVARAVLDAHRRGTQVRVITDNDKSNDLGSDIDHFKSQGIEVRFDRTDFHMHHKFAVFDSNRLLTGSYNWTRSAATGNQENLLITDDRRLVKQFQTVFDELWVSFR